MPQAQAQASLQAATGGDANPLNTTGLCLLSLDGGGVRGLSSLMVLKRIMDDLNYDRRKQNLNRVKPCEVFDMIGGTSTGGLIAIMLGRLGMDVNECIDAYKELSAEVFANGRRIPIGLSGNIKSRFDSAKLRKAILNIVRERGLHDDTQFDEGENERGCKVFVCATSKDLNGTERLRDYNYPSRQFFPCTVLEAALATSAATGFFDPISIDHRTFVDGALGANNPVEQVEGEATDVWFSDDGDLKPHVKCFLSIGTGNPGKKPIPDRVDKFLSETLVNIATETEKTANLFSRRWQPLYNSRGYFRFNVEQGLQDVGLEEHSKQGTIMTATEQYLDDVAQRRSLRELVENLKHKKNRAPLDLKRIVDEYNERISKHNTSNTKRSQHFIPFQMNRTFVGRTEILDTIRQKLLTEEQRGPHCVALVGLGGVGKTQVALEVAHWAKENLPDWSVFWFPALSMANFEQECRKIATKLQLPETHKDVRELIRHFLDSDASGRWLLILDNADDKELVLDGKESISAFLPRANHGRVLLTTRFRHIAIQIAKAEVVDIDQLSQSEGQELFQTSLIDKSLVTDEKSVLQLLEMLTYLPLAIAQAAAYLNTAMATSVRGYLKILSRSDDGVIQLLADELIEDFDGKPRRQAVATTWVTSFEQIQLDEVAAHLLSFVSFLEPKNIPIEMLPTSKGKSEKQRDDAIGLLCSYNFLQRQRNGTAVDMHRLVQVAMKAWLQRPPKGKRPRIRNVMQTGPSLQRSPAQETSPAEQARSQVVSHLSEIFRSASWEHREVWRQHLPHVMRVISNDTEEKNAKELGLMYTAAECCSMDGRYGEAISLMENAVTAEKKLAGTSTTLDHSKVLAQLYSNDGKNTAAITMLEHVAGVERTTLAKTDRRSLETQMTLAKAYIHDGRVSEAITLLENVIALRGMAFSETDVLLVSAQHVLGQAYLRDGRVKKATKLLEHVERIHSTALPEAHPLRLSTQHELGVAYREDGRVEEAINMLVHVEQVYVATRPETHSSRLDSQYELAMAYLADGRVYEAVTLLEQLVAIQGTCLAETHPSRLASQHALAMAYQQDTGSPQVKEAIALLEHIVAIEGTCLAETHISRLVSQQALAIAYHMNGRVKEAMTLIQHVVAVERKTMAETDPRRLASERLLKKWVQENPGD